jgi:hypothetical protein
MTKRRGGPALAVGALLTLGALPVLTGTTASPAWAICKGPLPCAPSTTLRRTTTTRPTTTTTAPPCTLPGPARSAYVRTFTFGEDKALGTEETVELVDETTGVAVAHGTVSGTEYFALNSVNIINLTLTTPLVLGEHPPLRLVVSQHTVSGPAGDVWRMGSSVVITYCDSPLVIDGYVAPDAFIFGNSRNELPLTVPTV